MSEGPDCTLYHGTSKENWDRIKTEGLIPRKERESEGTWGPLGIASNAHMNFFATTQILAEFVGRKSSGSRECVVLEIEGAVLDVSLLRADENWISRNALPDGRYVGYTEAAEISHCDDRWQESMTKGEAVGYEGRVNPELIKRAHVVTTKGEKILIYER